MAALVIVKQARWQRSVTGGGEEGLKKYLGGTEKIFLKFGCEDQKKGLYSKFVLYSGYNSRSGEHIHNLAGRNGILGCGSRFLPTNSGLKSKKKGLWHKVLGFVLAFTCVFRPGTRLYSRLGAGAVCCPKCTPVEPG